jgi:hypothetical protein
MDAIFAGLVSRLYQDGRLDMAVIHGDGTTTAAITSAGFQCEGLPSVMHGSCPEGLA